MKSLVRNAVRTPDGTILESCGRHDYVTHFDLVSKETYILDGGIDYVRSSVNIVPAEPLHAYLEDGHEAIRGAVTWGTYGKDGKSPFRRVAVADMETDHIIAVVTTQEHMNHKLRLVMLNELEYRFSRLDVSQNIDIKDTSIEAIKSNVNFFNSLISKAEEKLSELEQQREIWSMISLIKNHKSENK